jgi:hypothetical protein
MPNSTTAPIFVLGCQRSGTTLLCAVLNRHPALFIENELPWETYEHFDGGQTDIDDLSAQLAAHLNLTQSPSWLATQHAASPFGILELALRTRAGNLNKQSWGIKDPRLTYFLPQFLRAYPNSKAILLMRDARATAASIIPMREHIANAYYAAKLWKREVNIQLDLAERYATRILSVKYEDFVLEPERHLEQICHFLNIPYHTNMLDESNVVPITESRGTVNITTPISTDKIDQWKNALNRRQLGIIEHVAGDRLRMLGYEPVCPGHRPGVVERLWYDLQQSVMSNIWWQRRSRLRTLLGGRFALED